jgi:hypothetical protein
MPLRPVAIPPDTLARLAAIDARCDWTVTRGTQRSDRVFFCRVWERGRRDDYLVGGSSSLYRATFADALLAIVLAAESRGWHRPAGASPPSG